MEVHGIISGDSEDFESITKGVHSRDQDNQAHHDIDLKNETGSTLGAESFSTEVLEAGLDFAEKVLNGIGGNFDGELELMSDVRVHDESSIVLIEELVRKNGMDSRDAKMGVQGDKLEVLNGEFDHEDRLDESRKILVAPNVDLPGHVDGTDAYAQLHSPGEISPVIDTHHEEDDLMEEVSDLDRDSLAAEFEQQNKRQAGMTMASMSAQPEVTQKEVEELVDDSRMLFQQSNDEVASEEAVGVVLEKDDSNRKLSSEILDLERQLHELMEDHLKVVTRLKDLEACLGVSEAEKVELKNDVHSISKERQKMVDDLHKLTEDHLKVVTRLKDLETCLEVSEAEKVELKSHVHSILKERQKIEDDLVGKLETLESEKLRLLALIGESNTNLWRLEQEKLLLATQFDGLEQEKQSAEHKVSDLICELEIAHETLKFSEDRERVLVLKLEAMKKERVEETVEHAKSLQELQLQLQSLREENTHVVIKASKLDQWVEDLESEKVRLGGDLERLVQERWKMEEDLQFELRTLREHAQRLEVEKLDSVMSIGNLSSQLRRLRDDGEMLTGLVNDANQSIQHLLEEKMQLVEVINNLEQEKHVQEGEKMELAEGLRAVWEQLQAANSREVILTSEFRELSERRDYEEAMFSRTVNELEQEMRAINVERTDLSSKFLETSKTLETLREETSQTLKELQGEKAQLFNELAELVKKKQEFEEEIARDLLTWESQVRGLESEKAVSQSEIVELMKKVEKLQDEIQDLTDRELKSTQLIQELCGEKFRLVGEVDKLEGVKERQESERLELAAELQAAWDQIHAVRESEANLTTELIDVKDQQIEEKLRFDGLVQKLNVQVHELEEQKSQSQATIKELSTRLNELQKEQELQAKNAELTTKIVILEQEKDKSTLHIENLLGEMQSMRINVESLQADKYNLALEIDELNQWLQRPAAEMRQLATRLEEMTQLVSALEMEKSQLSTAVNNLEEERKRRDDEFGSLRDVVQGLEEEKKQLFSAREDSLGRIQSLEEEKIQVMMKYEESSLLVQNLTKQVEKLELEMEDKKLLHEDSQIWLRSLEEEKHQLELKLEAQSAMMEGLHVEKLKTFENVSNLGQEVGRLQVEVKMLNDQLFSLEEEKMNVTNLHQKSLHEQHEAAVLLEESNLLIVSLNEQLRILEEGNQKLTGSHQNLTIKVQLLDDEKAQTTRMLEESILAVQSLQVDTSKLICTISDLKEELVKAHEEIQTLNAEFSRIKEEKKNALLVHADLLVQFKLKEEEKVDLAKELEDSKLLNQSLQVDKLQLVSNVSKLREEIGKSQEDVLTLNDPVHSLQEENTSLLAAHHKSLLQMQALEEEKVDITRSLQESVDLAQKLETDKLHLQSVVMNLEQELERRREELQSQIVRIHDFGQDNDRLMSEYNSLLHQFKSVKEEAVHIVKSLNDSKSRVQNLELENADHAKAARRLKEEGQRSDEEIATLINQVLTLEEEKDKLTSLHEELLRQVHSLEQEKMHFVQLLEESKVLVESLEQERSQHNTAVSGLEQEVPEEIKTLKSHSWSLEEEVTSGERDYVLQLEDDNLQLRNALKDANVLVTDLQEEVDTLKSYVVDMEEGKEKSESGRVQLLAELSNLRKQVQVHEEKLEDSETSKKSRHEALELAKQIETYREQVVRLHEEKLQHSREIVELKQQLKCINLKQQVEDGDNLVSDVDDDVDQHKKPTSNPEDLETHEINVGNYLFGGELEQTYLDKVQINANLCQELQKLLSTVGGEKEKVAYKLLLRQEKTDLLKNLYQELDGLLLQVGNETERMAKEVSTLKHQESQDNIENQVRFELHKFRCCLAHLNAEKELLFRHGGGGLKSKLHASPKEKMELEKIVARLSSSFEESQKQLELLFTTKDVPMSPELHNRGQEWKYLQHSERASDESSNGLAHTCDPVDGKYAPNYMRDIEAKSYGKPVSQGSKSPEWMKKENQTMDYFSQRAPRDGRDGRDPRDVSGHKRCKINPQQPKRRWKV